MVKISTILGLSGLLLAALLAGCAKPTVASPGDDKGNGVREAQGTNAMSLMNEKVVKSDADWKKTLTSDQYRVLREKGTERAFTGQYWNQKSDGMYRCAGCGQTLFASDTKFDSGCGWPSFFAPMGTNQVETKDDSSFGMHRTEVLCSRCGGHLGHVFDDGPQPTGLRYCINSASLQFEKKPTPEGDPGKK
jgi:peptide-methionine (R)-S-oxide reductase